MPKPGLLTLGDSPRSTAGLQAFGANQSGLDQLKTGSCVIHQKSSYGRTTYAQAVPVVSTIGYAYWSQSLWGTNSGPVYVVLHREESGANVKWCLSLVNDAQLLATDIKLAVLITTKCVQLWQSDVYYVAIPAPLDHPYKVKGVVNGQNIDLTIVDGHVNNVTLSNAAATNTITGAAAGTYKAYIVVNKTGTVFPSTITWAVTGLNAAVPANDDTKAHVLIANVVVTVTNNVPAFTITQMVSTSLNTIRVKHNTGAADVFYLFNRV